MLLVGATPSYVASPFVLHGMMLGLTGALAAVGLLHYGHLYVIECIDSVLPFLHVQFSWKTLIILDEVLLCAGLAMGWLCSFLAVKRYVREAASPL